MKTYTEYHEGIMSEPVMSQAEAAADTRAARDEFMSSISSARDFLWREISDEEVTYELGDANTQFPVLLGEFVYPDVESVKEGLIQNMLGPVTVQVRFHKDLHPTTAARECMSSWMDNTGAHLRNVYDVVCSLDGLDDHDAEVVIDTIGDECGRTLNEWLDLAGYEEDFYHRWGKKRD